MSLNTKFITLEQTANRVLVNRNEEIRTAIVALLSKQHHLQVGVPGTAKSLLPTTLVALIDGGKFYHTMFTRQTKVEEVYGPLSFKGLEDDRVRFSTEGFLPWAEFAFTDEIFKGATGLLNSLLMLLNERKFRNDGAIHDVPLITSFMASNEFPSTDDLNALYDRIAFRHWISDITGHEDFMTMLNSSMNRPTLEPVVTMDDLRAAHDEIDTVNVEENTLDALYTIRTELDRNDIVVSSRTMVNSIGILRAAAWLRGADTVSPIDIPILRHVFWRHLDDRGDVNQVVMDNADPIQRDVRKIADSANSLAAEIQDTVRDGNSATRKAEGVGHRAKLQLIVTEFTALSKKAEAAGLGESPEVETIKKRLLALTGEVRTIFGPGGTA